MATPTPIGPIVFFVLTTIAYNAFTYSNAKDRELYLLTYILFCLVSQYFFNLTASNEVCGTAQFRSVLLTTLLPWLLIFVLVILFIQINPAWIAPFANTIGYGFVSMAGIKQLMFDIFKSPDEIANTGDQSWVRALNYIYNDQSLLINQITPSNFEQFWDSFSVSGIIKPEGGKLKNRLYRMVMLRNACGMATWQILAGALAILVSYSYVLTSECDIDAEELARRHDEYEQVLADRSATDKTSHRVYTTYE